MITFLPVWDEELPSYVIPVLTRSTSDGEVKESGPLVIVTESDMHLNSWTYLTIFLPSIIVHLPILFSSEIWTSPVPWLITIFLEISTQVWLFNNVLNKQIIQTVQQYGKSNVWLTDLEKSPSPQVKFY